MPEKGKTFAGEVREETVAWSKDTYQLLKQAEQGKVKSYVQDIALAVLDCKETATSRETFIRLMNERGYGVDWQDSHKYITYTDLAREQAGEKACKIRDNKLEKYYNMDFGKESMEHELLWSSIFVTLMANKIGGLQFGIYRNCQISSRVFHTAVAALPLTKANRSDFE